MGAMGAMGGHGRMGGIGPMAKSIIKQIVNSTVRQLAYDIAEQTAE